MTPEAPPRFLRARAPLAVWGLRAAAAAGLASGLAAGWAEGRVRVAWVLAVLAAGLGLAALASRLRRPADGDGLVGGAGYVVPERRRDQTLHSALTLLYNAGLMVVVLAALVRLDALSFSFSPALLRAFPALLGGYLVLLAWAVEGRIRDRGGVERTWYTRMHGWVLGAVAAGIGAAGAVLLAVGEVRRGAVPVLVESDLLVLVLAGILGVGTQLFLAANLPTVFDLASGIVRSVSRRRGLDTPPAMYAAIIGVAAMAAAAFLVVRLDLVGHLGDFRSARVALLLVAFPVGVAAFVGSTAWQMWRESRRGLYRRRLPTPIRNVIAVYAVSALGGILFGGLLFMHLTGRLPTLGAWGGRGLTMDLIALTVLATSGPLGMYMHRQHRRVDGVESRLADFLNDLAESRRAGLTLAAALQGCARSDYGALSPEVRKMAHQVAWGIPFTEALRQFADRVRTSLVRRSASLILESAKTGGSVAEILKAAAADAREIKSLEEERRVSMMTYLIVLYVVFFVFVTVLVVLDAQFIPQVLAANEASAANAKATGQSFGTTDVDRDAIGFAYYLAGVVQAAGNGLIAGILTEGRITAGLRHVAILVGSLWVVFRIALGA